MKRNINKKFKKRLISIIFLIFLIFLIIIGVVCFRNKTKGEKNNEVNSKIENDKSYKVISKYNANIKKSQDVKVKLNQIFRGEKAEKILNNYNEKASYKVDIEKKAEEELLLVEYEIDFMDYDMSTIGTNKDVSVRICQDENKEYIEYNNNIYSPLVECLNNDEFTKEKKTKGKFVTIIPKGCTEYKIKIGEKGEHESYFEGI